MEGTDDSGMIVWVRQSRDRHWPGVIVLGAHIGKKSATNGFCWVFLFGIHKTLEVHGSRTKPFFCDFKEHYESAKALGVFKKAVMESIQACAMRCNKQGKNTEQNLLKWAEDGFQMGGHSEETPYKRLLGGELPELVKSQFFDRKDLHVRTDQLVNTDNENGHYFMVPSPDHPEPNVPTRISVKSLKEGKHAVTKTGGETRVLLKRLSLNQEDRVSALGGQQVQQQVLRTRSRQESKRNGSHAESNTRRKPPLLLRRLSVNREDHVSTLGGQQLQQRTLRTRSLPESEQEGNHSESSTRRKPQVLLKRLSLNQGDPISAQGGRQVQQQVLRSRSQPESECEDSVVAVKRKKIEDRRITRSQSIESSAHHQTLTSIAHTELPKLSCTPQVVLTDIASGQVSDGTGPENGARQETSNIEGAEMRTSDVKNTKETLVDASDIYGRLIWGKFGSYRPWPGVTINGRSFGREMPPMGTTWVFWFGDHKISKIRDGQLQPFVPNFDRFFEMAKPGKIFVRAVLEAIMECSSRCKRGVPDEEDTLMAWAAEGFPTQINKSSLLCGGRIPPVVFKHVQIIESSDTEDEDEVSFQCVISPDKENQFNLIREGKSKIEDMCIACEALNFNVVIQHPVVRGGLCEDCRDSLMETVFAIEADGTKMYCSVCGDGGQLFVCDTPECGQVFCRGCVQLLVGKEALENICQSSSWVCYICRPHTPETHGLIEVKRNRVDNLIRLFSPNQQTPKMGPKKPLRVLSLFDGLATGLVVLERLGLDVEVYYASEVDPDSLTVVKVRHAGKAVHVGDVRDLTRSKIASLGRIDLLIGGSPCNDLSLCNPQRKGLHDGTGTGTLFFEYTRILKILQNQPTHLFWLFENTAAMPLGTKREISQYLKCDPAKWDARNFSAMERARYFWGNIPRLYCPLTKLPPCGRLTLTDMVTEGLGRIGQYQKIRTVTRNSNSLLQEKERKFPIVMDGHGDTIWINELERIFGFEEHYTDVGNFSHQRRRGMIGRAWSVPVVEHLLSPLKEFFSWKLQS